MSISLYNSTANVADFTAYFNREKSRALNLVVRNIYNAKRQREKTRIYSPIALLLIIREEIASTYPLCRDNAIEITVNKA